MKVSTSPATMKLASRGNSCGEGSWEDGTNVSEANHSLEMSGGDKIYTHLFGR